MDFSLAAILPVMIAANMIDSVGNRRLFAGARHSVDSFVETMLEVIESNGWRFSLRDLLLADNETYADGVEGKKTVSLKDKLTEVCNALFVADYDNGIWEIKIGQTSFTKETRQTLMQSVGLLSQFSDYS